MKEEIREIKPMEGLGTIRFGMGREEVRSILGDPTEIDTYSFTGGDDDLSESWHYDDLSLSMSFDEAEDWKLLTLAVSAGFYRLNDKSLIGLNRQSAEDELENMGIKDVEWEDWPIAETTDQKLLAANSIFVNFWFDGEILSEIQWSPKFDEDELILWPE